MKEHARLLKHGAHLDDKATLAVIKNVTRTPGANRDTSAALLLLQLPAPEGGSAGAGGTGLPPGAGGPGPPRLASPLRPRSPAGAGSLNTPRITKSSCR